MTMPIALVVDDEPQMVSIVAFALETQGFSCVKARNAREAWHALESQPIDIAIIDVMLPDASGIHLVKKIRGAGKSTPIIILTALSDENDRIDGLLAGADDYVTKPFSPRELALRAQAVVRRAGPHEEAPAVSVTLGPLHLDTVREHAFWDGKRIDLSTTEFRVLAVLAERHGQVVPYVRLLTDAWGTSSHSGGREMIKTTIYRLRKHLAEVGADPALIESVRGKGYCLVTGV